MNITFFKKMGLLFGLICLVVNAGAAEVVVENGTLQVNGVDEGSGLGAVSVVLVYGGNLSVQSVNGDSGFMVASNIKNENFQTFIAGISTEGRTGNVEFASVVTTGVGNIEVLVRELTDVKGDAIPYSNNEFTGTVPSASGDGDEVSGSYVFDESTTESVGVTPTESVEETQSVVVSPTHTPMESGVSSATMTTSVSGSDNEKSVITAAGTDPVSTPPTQSPFSIFAVLFSIGSIFILKKKK